MRVAFDLDFPTQRYKIIVGAVAQDLATVDAVAQDFDEYVPEKTGCINYIQDKNIESDAYAEFDEDCFINGTNIGSEATNFTTQASLWFMIRLCDSDTTIHQEITTVTVHHLLRGNATAKFIVDDFDIEINQELEVVVSHQLEHLRLGDATDMETGVVTLLEAGQELVLVTDNLAKETVVVALTADDCAMLSNERDRFHTRPYISVESDNIWTADCDVIDNVFRPTVLDTYLTGQGWCWCVLTETGKWEDKNYLVTGIITSGNDIITSKGVRLHSRRLARTSSLVGQTTTGRFTVRRTKDIEDHPPNLEQEEVDTQTWWFAGIAMLASVTVLVLLCCRGRMKRMMPWTMTPHGRDCRCRNCSTQYGYVGSSTAGWEARLRTPTFLSKKV